MAKLTFVPGDELRAELPVRAGTQDLKLVWETSGSRTYPFDQFEHEPRLLKPGGTSEPAVGVKLAGNGSVLAAPAGALSGVEIVIGSVLAGIKN